ncbi:MAG: transposase [Patescibacteria group bacterium]
MPQVFTKLLPAWHTVLYTDAKKPILRDAKHAYLFSHYLYDLQREIGFTLCGWVILPDHVHILIHTDQHAATTVINAIVEKTADFMKQSYSGGVSDFSWEPVGKYRYINTTAEFENTLASLFYDPVVHGMVDDPIDYSFSSYHHFLHDFGERGARRIASYSKKGSSLHETQL